MTEEVNYAELTITELCDRTYTLSREIEAASKRGQRLTAAANGEATVGLKLTIGDEEIPLSGGAETFEGFDAAAALGPEITKTNQTLIRWVREQKRCIDAFAALCDVGEQKMNEQVQGG